MNIWGVDIETCSELLLFQLLQQCDTSALSIEREAIRHEFIKRGRRRGLSDQQLINKMVQGTIKGRNRDAIAKDWAAAFGLTFVEFKRIADS